MPARLKISFHDIDASPALEKRVREKVAKLEKIYPITSAQVFIKALGNKQRQGRQYSVRIDLKLPGGEVVVSHSPGVAKKPKRHEEIYAAMNDAFLAVEKQMRHFKDVMKNEQRLHKPVLASGLVTEINLAKGYGYIETADGDTIYFHENSVQAERFSELKVGRRVRFSIAEGEGVKGPQANIVRVRATPKT